MSKNIAKNNFWGRIIAIKSPELGQNYTYMSVDTYCTVLYGSINEEQKVGQISGGNTFAVTYKEKHGVETASWKKITGDRQLKMSITLVRSNVDSDSKKHSCNNYS
jgi:hypothetical protein